jgi:hypothetical protein
LSGHAISTSTSPMTAASLSTSAAPAPAWAPALPSRCNLGRTDSARRVTARDAGEGPVAEGGCLARGQARGAPPPRRREPLVSERPRLARGRRGNSQVRACNGGGHALGDPLLYVAGYATCRGWDLQILLEKTVEFVI